LTLAGLTECTHQGWLLGDDAFALAVMARPSMTGLGSASAQRELKRLEQSGLIVAQLTQQRCWSSPQV
jgi:hypothetical protein